MLKVLSAFQSLMIPQCNLGAAASGMMLFVGACKGRLNLAYVL